ncbi:Lipopolysaccharide biosynthesis regulator YciM, contains six TPR domains and a predicted metal-binding C-terminal domain [Desulfonatronum thiosulfatophilum]|uniref:Lipopolysaccharide biosynthesis regulator YciM, contains six TPR domains and a predicted metal-binding C-terminal domain n=1 Tax=Desulfonatronum thiosulfatophilum TaxID=617002 RepID=A0A1G6CIN0_9BACT|nr:tetratricopeptide repeat protein [Desulfonatronum thiosulfatophilum]SDB32747.1 Lipopolysaccharide biosynthesis regulator YciM, contains six TPR domains and a predicted metal-binding C-terminal domain [Desulfonatronum thiosulfatophilum]
MSGWIKTFFSSRSTGGERFPGEVHADGLLPPSEDTFSAINELSRVVKNNPDAVEIYLALGNLYRSQGEIERAVHIRQNLILRPGLHPEFKARALYELGRDYKRGGFVDRAFDAFQQARKIAGNNPAINHELARLSADSEEFLQAAKYYGELGNSIAEAHYLVRQAQKECRDNPKSSQIAKWIDRALKVFPGSTEAWLEKLQRVWKGLEKGKPSKILDQAMGQVPEQMRFVLLEGLLTTSREGSCTAGVVSDMNELEDILAILSGYPQDMLLQYYGGLLLLDHGRLEDARIWFEKCLLLDSNFWLARLELLALARKRHDLPRSLDVQLDFFISRAREVKNYACRQCGLKREMVFFVCPRCGAWHSISFRHNLNE